MVLCLLLFLEITLYLNYSVLKHVQSDQTVIAETGYTLYLSVSIFQATHKVRGLNTVPKNVLIFNDTYSKALQKGSQSDVLSSLATIQKSVLITQIFGSFINETNTSNTNFCVQRQLDSTYNRTSTYDRNCSVHINTSSRFTRAQGLRLVFSLVRL